MWKYVAAAIAAGTALGLYCCLRTGAREDRRMEELRRRKEEEELDELLKELEGMSTVIPGSRRIPLVFFILFTVTLNSGIKYPP